MTASALQNIVDVLLLITPYDQVLINQIIYITLTVFFSFECQVASFGAKQKQFSINYSFIGI